MTFVTNVFLMPGNMFRWLDHPRPVLSVWDELWSGHVKRETCVWTIFRSACCPGLTQSPMAVLCRSASFQMLLWKKNTERNTTIDFPFLFIPAYKYWMSLSQKYHGLLNWKKLIFCRLRDLFGSPWKQINRAGASQWGLSISRWSKCISIRRWHGVMGGLTPPCPGLAARTTSLIHNLEPKGR